MNVKLLRKVKEHILEEPRRFQMGDVVHRGEPGTTYSDFGIEYKVPSCGTVACIAGWASVLSGEKSRNWDMENAQRLLNISHWQGSSLFLVGYWPDKFEKQWDKAKTPRGRASAAARRIEHFIATKGAE